MANYLVTIASNGSVGGAPEIPAPAGAVVEWRKLDEPVNALEKWTVEVVVAGSIAAWTKGDAPAAFWDYMERLLQCLEVRPQGRVTFASRTDGHRVAAAFAYFGSRELKRCESDLRERVAALADPKSHKLTHDLELTVH